ncbi:MULTISPECIES: hypothetical protein [Kitasatospora]|uniref:Uncharacterized protein n=1 Tax=Kitasatospora setae (strain ATCC 33774 / DSM 43861 / JCM 3304 / KCC A-0304 / NBRC 14216 / KM-6054) TaxID=452652 RepID=E4N3F8_KITSK|nr:MULTISPECIES: hypothetical protein [Kitasatospora]BAJ32692.1 hypothetical protein KSE_69340 [Kitasatospora setae KM-6054]
MQNPTPGTGINVNPAALREASANAHRIREIASEGGSRPENPSRSAADGLSAQQFEVGRALRETADRRHGQEEGRRC